MAGGTNGTINGTAAPSLLASVAMAARAARAAGISVLPIAGNGTKKTELRTWKEYQERRPNEDEIRRWFGAHLVP